MKEMCSKLNSTQRIVVNFLQQVVTECTDRVLVTQPCTVASTTDYSVPTGYTALYSYPNNWLEFTDRVPATQPALNSLLHISWLQSLLAYYQLAPRITNSKVFYQLPTSHQQPIHRPKTDDRPNNV